MLGVLKFILTFRFFIMKFYYKFFLGVFPAVSFFAANGFADGVEIIHGANTQRMEKYNRLRLAYNDPMDIEKLKVYSETIDGMMTAREKVDARLTATLEQIETMFGAVMSKAIIIGMNGNDVNAGLSKYINHGIRSDDPLFNHFEILRYVAEFSKRAVGMLSGFVVQSRSALEESTSDSDDSNLDFLIPNKIKTLIKQNMNQFKQENRADSEKLLPLVKLTEDILFDWFANTFILHGPGTVKRLAKRFISTEYRDASTREYCDFLKYIEKQFQGGPCEVSEVDDQENIRTFHERIDKSNIFTFHKLIDKSNIFKIEYATLKSLWENMSVDSRDGLLREIYLSVDYIVGLLKADNDSDSVTVIAAPIQASSQPVVLNADKKKRIQQDFEVVLKKGPESLKQVPFNDHSKENRPHAPNYANAITAGN